MALHKLVISKINRRDALLAMNAITTNTNMLSLVLLNQMPCLKGMQLPRIARMPALVRVLNIACLSNTKMLKQKTLPFWKGVFSI
jgi:hypothetical protein